MSAQLPTIAIAPPMPLLEAALGGGQPASTTVLSRSTYFPLTPSPTSPFRAHRTNSSNGNTTATTKPTRQKPYHRPSPADLKLHHHSSNLTQCILSSTVSSPFSPITPTSLSSSSSTATTPSTLSYGYQPSRLSRSHSAFEAAPPTTTGSSKDDINLEEHGDSGLLTPISTAVAVPRRQGLVQRTESLPVLVPLTQQHQQHQSNQCAALNSQLNTSTTSNNNNLTIPVFASTSSSESKTSPVVFTADYLEARLAKFGGKIGGPPPPVAAAAPAKKVESVQGCQDSTDVLALIKDFPYASAYVDVSGVAQPQVAHHARDSGVMAQAAPAAPGREEEIRKQRYAVDLIGFYANGSSPGGLETAIKTIHKIWPETQEPDREAVPGPVTSEGKLRASFVTQPATTTNQAVPQDKAAARLRRHPSAQQFTPESSPDSSRRKRKRGDASEAKDGDDKVSKRSCVGEAKIAYPTCPRVLTPPVEPKPEPQTKATSTSQSSHHISLKLFVRELLRRSKTSCNTLEVALCYLDGIEETVKKLRDCLKLGIAFGTVAMAERGPYDEGMKDEGRIITAVEWMKQEAMKLEDEGMDVRGDWSNSSQQGGQEWAPLSPPGSDSSASDKAGRCSAASSAPTTQILATHPLLDARRTFLASLVLATKFIQDKAYSNKAWAKLSGLAGKEVGRCERALGGALQWRLWVGKECGASSRARSPFANEEVESLCSGDSETVVHGDNDPLAKAFIEEAMKKQKKHDTGVAVVGSLAPVATALAPAEVLARLYGDAFAKSRVGGCGGRARTWHAPELQQPQHEDVRHQVVALLQQPSSTFSSAASVASATSTLLDQLSTFNLDAITPATQATFIESQTSVAPTAFGMPFVHSPLSLEGERLLDELLKAGEECEVPATVKMNVDDSACGTGKNKTPVMSMATSFPNNEPLPSAGFIDSWQPQSLIFPFTFTSLLPSKAQQQPLVSARLSPTKPQVQQRSASLGSLPRLLHPQTAALRASGSSTSPHSSSTFSSPEVLTPVHSRAGTLVDVAECYQDWTATGAMGRGNGGKEFQQYVDQLYAGGQYVSALQL
ncbi:hypothetical protein FRB90_000888 [Tulasnella sp. 427]|nr:hypothetical protein FRB90_000888 [Tulasnella sp. 427]